MSWQQQKSWAVKKGQVDVVIDEFVDSRGVKINYNYH